PVDDVVPPEHAPPSPGGPTTHIVQPGENLFRISLRYGTTVDAIANKSRFNVADLHLPVGLQFSRLHEAGGHGPSRQQ
ncbi:MAG: LysM peptidoglycan-binding domain-containing protein, partial [Deltaproteobacteria bacterium]|nr:LysM peptidoglycan-binding domain-containing protein [Deltaproteobacteria bacterium]